MKKNTKILVCIFCAGLAAGGIGYTCLQTFKTTNNTVSSTSSSDLETVATNDGTITFTLYDEDGKENKVETTLDEIENNKEIKEKWEKYQETISSATSGDEIVQDEEHITEQPTSVEDTVDPVLDYDDYLKNKKEYSDEPGSVSDEKCERLLEKAKTYYDEMLSGKRDKDSYFINAYKNLKEKYTEERYHDLKNNLVGVTGSD